MPNNAIAIRTFGDWQEDRSRFLEPDLVSHCGESPERSYLNTLSTADVATEFIHRALEASRSAESTRTTDGKGEALNRLIRELKGYCREVLVAIDHIQRAWIYISDIDAMILTIYQQLYGIYPPKFPTIFRELLPHKWKARENPGLL